MPHGKSVEGAVQEQGTRQHGHQARLWGDWAGVLSILSGSFRVKKFRHSWKSVG